MRCTRSRAAVAGLAVLLLCAVAIAEERKPFEDPVIRRGKKGEWNVRLPGSSRDNTISTRYFMPSPNCVDAVVEIKLVAGEAHVVVKEVSNVGEGSSSGNIKPKEGMRYVFGQENCRIEIKVTPLR